MKSSIFFEKSGLEVGRSVVDRLGGFQKLFWFGTVALYRIQQSGWAAGTFDFQVENVQVWKLLSHAHSPPGNQTHLGFMKRAPALPTAQGCG